MGLCHTKQESESECSSTSPQVYPEPEPESESECSFTKPRVHMPVFSSLSDALKFIMSLDSIIARADAEYRSLMSNRAQGAEIEAAFERLRRWEYIKMELEED